MKSFLAMTLFLFCALVTLDSLSGRVWGDDIRTNSSAALRVLATSAHAVKTPPAVPGTAGTRFRECSSCPEMVVIPKGNFQLRFNVAPTFGVGDQQDKVIQVELKRNFAVGIYDVTVNQYSQFVSETHRKQDKGCEILDATGYWIDDPKADWRNPTFPQSGRDPVVCVSWQDAHAYIAWLNAKVRGTGTQVERAAGGPYRLMTGEEYSYLARADGMIPRGEEKHWGDYVNLGADDCWPCGSAKRGLDHWNYTSPVGSFRPNSFGVYDLVGNVWALLEDCEVDRVQGAPTDGSALLSQGDCNMRVGAGKSWDDTPEWLMNKPADVQAWLTSFPWGGSFLTTARNYANGFRVARTLD